MPHFLQIKMKTIWSYAVCPYQGKSVNGIIPFRDYRRVFALTKKVQLCYYIIFKLFSLL